MPQFDDIATTAASPQAVWKVLYNPLRFPDWWAGVETVQLGDTLGGGGDVTMWPTGYPDFPMPQRVETSSVDHRVVISCTISDLVFDWRLEDLNPGTRVSVHVEIPEREAARLAAQQELVASSLRRLLTVAAE